MFGLQSLSILGGRLIGVAALLSSIYAVYWYVDHRGYMRGHDEVKAQWDSDRAERKLAAELQAADSREKERVANEKTRQAQLSYAQARAELAIALGRLRDQRLCIAQAVPRIEGLRVAGSGQAPMPGTAEGTARTAQYSTLAADARPIVTIGDALEDTLQCSRLIKWVRDQGM